MPWHIYRSTDADAPVLTGQNGSLIALLEACLVNGYSTGPTAHAGAGWTKTHTGTNKAVFQAGPAARARFFVRVNDANGNRAQLVSYETMEDVDNGTNPTPKPTHVQTVIPCYKSAGNDATARPWVIAADERTVVLLVKTGASASNSPQYPNHWTGTTFGECISYRASDPYQWVMGGCYYDASFDCGLVHVQGASSSFSSGGGLYVDRDHIGTPGSKEAVIIYPRGHGGFIEGTSPNANVFKHGAVNPADNKVWTMPMAFRHWTGTELCVRGELRGLRFVMVASTSYSDGDVLTDGQGRSWIYYRSRIGVPGVAGQTHERAVDLLIESSTPPTS